MLRLDSVDSVAPVIQVALTPVFLPSDIAPLLGVLSTRLARVADRVDALAEQLETAERVQRSRLQAPPDLSAATLARPRRGGDDEDFGRDRHVSRGRKRSLARFEIRRGFLCSSPSGSRFSSR